MVTVTVGLTTTQDFVLTWLEPCRDLRSGFPLGFGGVGVDNDPAGDAE